MILYHGIIDPITNQASARYFKAWEEKSDPPHLDPRVGTGQKSHDKETASIHSRPGGGGHSVSFVYSSKKHSTLKNRR